MSPTLDASGAPRVSVIIVAHDGERWLPHLVRSLEASTRDPHRVIAVDTGSTDGSHELLADAFGDDAVINAPHSSGFGHAVEVAVAALDGWDSSDPDSAVDPDNDWLWLLHDDCAPAPDALELLLLTLRENPGLAAVGCRLRAWPRAQRLLEVGVTITGTGHRETGLELGEYDQGQHDGIRRVLAVSSAGLLVRRRVWNELGGFDRRLPLFRDDVDFGWRVAKYGEKLVISPDAIVFHAEASARGVREISNTSASPHRADRRAAIYTLLANCSIWVLPTQYVRLFLGSLLRALGYLVGKLPGAALDEVAGCVAALARPDRIIAARLARRRTTVASARRVRALLPAWWTPYANGSETVASRFADSLRDTATSLATSARRWRNRGDGTSLESGPVDDDAVGLAPGSGPVEWLVRHPGRSLTAVLAVLAFVATRGLWGAGSLHGGALIGVPDGATAWWSLYREAWHPVGLGSSDDTSPYVAVLASAASVLLGKAWLVVDLLILMAVPLCAWGAFVASALLVRPLAARVWIAVSYGLLPVVTGAVGAGRLGTVAAAILLPWLVRALIPMLSPAGDGAWRRPFVAGLLLAVMIAFCPMTWVTAGLAAAVAVLWLAATSRWVAVGQLAVVLLLPALLLVPWSLELLGEPSRLLSEAGVLDPATAPVSNDVWHLVFGRLGAAGDAPWWLGAGFVLAAVVSLLRADRRREIAAVWVVIAAAFATVGLFASHIVAADGSRIQAYPWFGFPVLLAQAAAIVAAAVAADGVTAYIQSGTFGWRQPLAAFTVVVAAASPLLGVVWWVGAAPHGDLQRTTDNTLPAYLVDTLQSSAQQRMLVLRGDAAQVEYDVIQDDGFRLGDDSVDPVFSTPELDRLIAAVLSEGQPADLDALAGLGFGYVMLPAPYDRDVVAALDGLPGLVRSSTDPDLVVGWQLTQPTGPTTVDPGGHRGWWLIGEGLALLVVIVLATPSARRREGIAEVVA